MTEAAKSTRGQAAREALANGSKIWQARAAWKRAAQPFNGFRFHDLRHQAITELAEAGTDDATLMARAGHMSRRMMEHYSHVRMERKRRAPWKGNRAGSQMDGVWGWVTSQITSQG